MKMITNCRIYKTADCPFLRWPTCHAGYTSKSGPETWWHCAYHKKPIRHIKSCGMAGNHKLQKETWIDSQYPNAI